VKLFFLEFAVTREEYKATVEKAVKEKCNKGEHSFQQIFESLNCYPTIIHGSELYLSGKMNTVIKEVLNGAEKVGMIFPVYSSRDVSEIFGILDFSCLDM